MVSGTPTQLGFAIPLSNEVQLAPGTSTTISNEFISTNTNNPIYDATLSATGLPPGVTASFSPQMVQAGGANGSVEDESFTMTLTASGTAPLAQNVQWGIVATPTADVPPTTVNYLLDITPASGGAGWNNQTSYVSTRATPFSAVYDPAHELIYSANQVSGPDRHHQRQNASDHEKHIDSGSQRHGHLGRWKHHLGNHRLPSDIRH